MLSRRTLAIMLAVCVTFGCATSSSKPPDKSSETENADALRKRMDTVLNTQRSTAGDPSLAERAREIIAAIRKEVENDYQNKLNSMFGVPEPLIDETVELEAVDENGDVAEVPVVVKTRQLRSLTDPEVTPAATRLLADDDLAAELYENVPQSVEPEKIQYNERIYTAAAADAIAMEVRLIVSLKGGEWVSAVGNATAANAVAIRGLDLTHGLTENSNQTYDDTVFMIFASANGDTEVHEFRMTTESSNNKVGVGRLNSKQVFYQRGLHRGKDPAFRLLGNAAPGTRVGRKGEFQITGANIHSAYTSRRIDSTTPLSPNVSLGCQVIAASKPEFERIFVRMLEQRGVRQFPYMIVEDDEVREFERLLNEQSVDSILVRALPRS